MPRVVCAILGGGRGTRLYPLTRERCKPAVPLAAKYRLIDIPISNCLNSGYGRIFVVTQFNTASLHRHIARSYPFDALSGRSVAILAAEQTLQRMDWYQGTADAIRHNLRHLRLEDASHVLILSGDHLYRMDYRKLIGRHDDCGADVTIAVQPVTAAEAGALGVVRMDRDGMIASFAEKPGSEKLTELQLPKPLGTDPETGEDLTHLASMGIYVFKPQVLVALLETTDYEDFGREVIPLAIGSHRVAAFVFGGYWRDIGTISAFYAANLDLTRPVPRFDIFDPSWPIYTRARYLPPAKLEKADVRGCLVAEGCIIVGSRIAGSVVGLRSVVASGCQIRNSILMGHDFYEFSPAADGIALGIGADCHIEGAIIDKNVRIGDGVVIRGRPGSGIDVDAGHYFVRDGIVIVPRSQTVEPGAEIAV